MTIVLGIVLDWIGRIVSGPFAAWERAINHWRLSLPSLDISPGYSRCAGPGEKYQKDSD